jgi:UPF0755 protein
MTYSLNTSNKKGGVLFKRLLIVGFAVALLVAGVLVAGARYLSSQLKAVSTDDRMTSVQITSGMSTVDIGKSLEEKGLIRSETAFGWYVRTRNAARYLQAGTYDLSPSQSTPDIVAQLTHGKVATKLVTIAPGLRLDQIRTALIRQGYTAADVDAALEPTQYESKPVLADKPKGQNLEGYLYPDSFQRTADTKLKTIVEQSLSQMEGRLTPSIRSGFAKQGLTVYQGITLASIVEQEVVHQQDRAQAAQVFLKRLRSDISLGSDVTAFYGSELAGAGKDVNFDTPYNTRLHKGLPPTPISNITTSSLEAVARPANTDWLFFVAGDDGTTYFSKTVEEHERLTAEHCKKLCQ